MGRRSPAIRPRDAGGTGRSPTQISPIGRDDADRLHEYPGRKRGQPQLPARPRRHLQEEERQQARHAQGQARRVEPRRDPTPEREESPLEASADGTCPVAPARAARPEGWSSPTARSRSAMLPAGAAHHARWGPARRRGQGGHGACCGGHPVRWRGHGAGVGTDQIARLEGCGARPATAIPPMARARSAAAGPIAAREAVARGRDPMCGGATASVGGRREAGSLPIRNLAVRFRAVPGLVPADRRP